MLVTFTCKAYENITMFGDVAKKLLQLMGHSASIPGALTAKEIPSALSRLQAVLKQNPSMPGECKKGEEDDLPISLAQRAFPLINMLEAAIKADCSVMWQQV